MLMSMADALINYAMEAIAQYIAIGIARMFAGIGGGGGGYQLPQGASPVSNIPFSAGGISYAGGGYTG